MLEADFSEFKVYAYNTGTDNIATATAIGTAFINGEEVTKAAEGAWGMSTTHYWPVSDNIQFLLFLLKQLSVLIYGMLQQNTQVLHIPSKR